MFFGSVALLEQVKVSPVDGPNRDQSDNKVGYLATMVFDYVRSQCHISDRDTFFRAVLTNALVPTCFSNLSRGILGV